MYIPKLFKMDDHAEIFDFIRQNSFGILINADNDVPVATHIPIELEFTDENEPILRGHVSKVNPHALLFEKNPQALVIFTGAHTYISSSWYVQENVSTWNYTAVHVYGHFRQKTQARWGCAWLQECYCSHLSVCRNYFDE